MSSSFGRPLHVYYVCVLFIVMTALGFGARFYWVNGAANVESVTSVYEAIIQIDEIKKKSDLKEIKELVESDRARDALKEFDLLTKDIESLNLVEEVESYEDLEATMKSMRKGLSELISTPELTNIFVVFNNKVSAFESYVEANNWKTLTRMSRRITTLISSGRVKSPGFFKVDALENLIRTISKDIAVMESITESSVLTRKDKNEVITKLRMLMTEMDMLGKYVVSLSSFYKVYNNFATQYKTWFSQIEPEISYKKVSFEKNSQTILFSLIGLIGMIFILTVAGFFIHKIVSKNESKKLEEVILSSIKNGIVPVVSKFDGHFSENFRMEFDRYREYVHKRMSFGSIFQDAMPFSSLLLDSNLNLVWANSLFYEHWELQKKNDENVTWDYLQRFTNLGEDDPVLMALNEGIAGIYNIQVKNTHNEEALPYEMYVSPVEYASQKRIMIFFYPLRSIEEALSNQSRSLVSPVAKSLDALTNGVFTSEFKEKVKKDFEIAGTTDIYERFLKYNEFVNNQKNGLLAEIESLENNLFDQYKLVDDIDVVCHEYSDIQKTSMNHMMNTKDAIVSLVELRAELEDLFKATVGTSQSLFQDEMTLLSHTSELADIIDENKKAIEIVSRTKDDFKMLKNNVEQFKTKIMQMLDHLMTARKSDSGQSKMDHSLSKMKLEMQSFEKNLSSLSQVATSLDVGLSKMQLIMSKSDTPDLSVLKMNFDTAREQLERDLLDVARLIRNGQMKDEEVIKSIKGLFSSFKNGKEKIEDITRLRYRNNHAEEIDLMVPEMEHDGQLLAEQ